jgi:hypothetical protein
MSRATLAPAARAPASTAATSAAPKPIRKPVGASQSAPNRQCGRRLKVPNAGDANAKHATFPRRCARHAAASFCSRRASKKTAERLLAAAFSLIRQRRLCGQKDLYTQQRRRTRPFYNLLAGSTPLAHAPLNGYAPGAPQALTHQLRSPLAWSHDAAAATRSSTRGGGSPRPGSGLGTAVALLSPPR